MTDHFKGILVTMLLVAIVFSLASCSMTNGPEPSTAFEPVTAVDSGAFTISMLVQPALKEDNKIQQSMAYLQKLLMSRGWNVKLTMTAADINTQTMEYDAVQALKMDTAAGIQADGYIVSAAEAQSLRNAGLTQDLTGALPEVAPAFFEKLKDSFGKSIVGVPLYIAGDKKASQLVLHIQKDAISELNTQSITMSELVTFLEKNKKLKIGVVNEIFGFGNCFHAILRAWACEQGYYPLDLYWINGDFFAALNDQKYTPVPIENIPGFDEFFERSLNVFNEKRFIDISEYERLMKEDVVGYIGPLEDVNAIPDLTYRLSFLSSHKKSGKDYVAIPLSGCIRPAAPMSKAHTGATMLVISAPSTKTTQAIKLVQWALIDQKNYDLVQYGAEGKDYRLDGERVEYLVNGKELKPEDWDLEKSTAYFIRNFNFFRNDTMNHVTVYESDHSEAVYANIQPVTHPIWSVKQLQQSYYDLRPLYSQIDTEFDQIINNRISLLGGSLVNDNGDTQDSIGKKCLSALRAMGPDTKKLVTAYQLRLMELSGE